MPGGARTLTPVFDAPARRGAYRALVIAGLDAAGIEQIRATLQRDDLGSDRFRQAVERQLGRRVGPGRAGPRRIGRGNGEASKKGHSDRASEECALRPRFH